MSDALENVTVVEFGAYAAGPAIGKHLANFGARVIHVESEQRVTAPQAAMWVGVEAAMGTLTALTHRTATGQEQHVDVSAQAAVLSALAHAPVFWDMLGVNPARAGTYITGRSITGAKMRAFWACRDGWINFIIYGGAAGRHTNEQLVTWMHEKSLAGSFALIDRVRLPIRHGAPRAGQHNDEILAPNAGAVVPGTRDGR